MEAGDWGSGVKNFEAGQTVFYSSLKTHILQAEARRQIPETSHSLRCQCFREVATARGSARRYPSLHAGPHGGWIIVTPSPLAFS